MNDQHRSVPRPSQVEFEILGLLTNRTEMYGLEMVKASNKLKRGTIYVTLFRMEEKGWLTSRPEEGENRSGSPRRLYKINAVGTRVKRAADAAAVAYAEPEGLPQGA